MQIQKVKLNPVRFEGPVYHNPNCCHFKVVPPNACDCGYDEGRRIIATGQPNKYWVIERRKHTDDWYITADLIATFGEKVVMADVVDSIAECIQQTTTVFRDSLKDEFFVHLAGYNTERSAMLDDYFSALIDLLADKGVFNAE